MAYLYAPQLLKSRSPARFAFIEANKAKWGPILAAPGGKKALLPPGFVPPGAPLPEEGMAYV
jgi:hypothetical protein